MHCDFLQGKIPPMDLRSRSDCILATKNNVVIFMIQVFFLRLLDQLQNYLGAITPVEQYQEGKTNIRKDRQP